MSRKPRVLVAMSGGVDSAVAAALLHRQGYDVIGVTLRLYTETDDGALRSKRACCGIEDVADARDAARRIGIPHYVLNMEREFERDVIDYFVDSYAAGRTPNPCLACNQYVKFSTLLDRATGMGVDTLATGHYARIIADSDERFRLLAAVDDAKDQSYVLYTLGQRELARTLFPLGEMPKSEVRRVAGELGLAVAGKPDSADICFVPRGDYRTLLSERGVEMRPGPIVTCGRRAGRRARRRRGVHGRSAPRARHCGAAAAIRHGGRCGDQRRGRWPGRRAVAARAARHRCALGGRRAGRRRLACCARPLPRSARRGARRRDRRCGLQHRVPAPGARDRSGTGRRALRWGRRRRRWHYRACGGMTPPAERWSVH